MSPKLLSVRTAEVSVNKATEAWAFHYLNPLSAGNKNHIKEENSLKKQLTVFTAYVSGVLSLGGNGVRCKPHSENAGKNRAKE